MSDVERNDPDPDRYAFVASTGLAPRYLRRRFDGSDGDPTDLTPQPQLYDPAARFAEEQQADQAGEQEDEDDDDAVDRQQILTGILTVAGLAIAGLMFAFLIGSMIPDLDLDYVYRD